MYRLAAIWAAAAVPLWVAIIWMWQGAATWPEAAHSIDWHARSMVSGFVGAAIVSFLIAPARRWPVDRSTVAWALVLTWFAARALSLCALPIARFAPLADVAFFAIAAFVLIKRAVKAPAPSNLLFACAPIVLMLSILAPLLVLELASVLIAVIAGKVIPGLVNGRLPSRPARLRTEVERIAIGALALAIALRVLLPDSAVADLAAAFAALAHLRRWWGWSPFAAARTDLRLAMLLIAYAWLPVWLLTSAAGEWAPPQAGTHALAVGLVGGMIWAMMNRTLAAGTRLGLIERLGAAALIVAALARFSLAFVAPAWQDALVALSAGAWSLAFVSLALRGIAIGSGRDPATPAGARSR